MGNIKDLPFLERPREKAFRFGINSLSDSELLAIIIGQGVRGYSALDIANDIIKDNRGLFNACKMPYQDFAKYKGMSSTKSIILAAAFEIAKRYQVSCYGNETISSMEELYHRYEPKLSSLEQEVMVLVVLSKKQKIIYETTLFKGTTSNVNYSFREIFKEIIIHNGFYFYLIHNHPNGSLVPSQKDIVFTTELIKESQKIHLVLLDHLIIGENGFYSFALKEVKARS